MGGCSSAKVFGAPAAEDNDDGLIKFKLNDKNIKILQRQISQDKTSVDPQESTELVPPSHHISTGATGISGIHAGGLFLGRSGGPPPLVRRRSEPPVTIQENVIQRGSKLKKYQSAQGPRHAAKRMYYPKRGKHKKKNIPSLEDINKDKPPPETTFHMGSGEVLNAAGRRKGEVFGDGRWENNGMTSLTFHSDGRLTREGDVAVVRLRPDRTVWHLDKRGPMGKILKDGTVQDSRGRVIGHATADGSVFDNKGTPIGSCTAGMAQAAFIHFFAPKLAHMHNHHHHRHR